MYKNEHHTVTAQKSDWVYYVRTKVIPSKESVNRAVLHDEAILRHHYMGHSYFQMLHRMSQLQPVKGISQFERKLPEACTYCVKGKLTQEPFNTMPDSRRQSALELPCTDLSSPFLMESLRGSKYFMGAVQRLLPKWVNFFLEGKGRCPDAIHPETRNKDKPRGETDSYRQWTRKEFVN